MSKQAVSVTLTAENLLWLRGQARASGVRSLSAALDHVVAAARTGGHVHESTIRSVVGTISISNADPELRAADAAVRALFTPLTVADAGGQYRRTITRSKSRRRRRQTR